MLDGLETFPHDLSALPSMKTIPGHYTPANIPYTRNLILYDLIAFSEIFSARYKLFDGVLVPTEPTELADPDICIQRVRPLPSQDTQNTKPPPALHGSHTCSCF
jgi:hypothetical protein